MRMHRSAWVSTVADFLPHGYHLAENDWQRRHRLLLYVLVAHVPGLALFGLILRRPPDMVLLALAVPAACLLLGWLLSQHRRAASLSVTGGLVYSSAALVVLTEGTIEAHFHFFIIIGFIALYQDWVPFLFNVLFTVISHGVGSAWQQTVIFSHPAAQGNPWLWSLIHGIAVLIACAAMAVFWRVTEDSQREKDALQQQLAAFEINRRQFTSEMLVNLARRNQSMLYRQLEIINQLEESEQDPDALAELFKLDHLATRVQRNAESLLVLSGEQPARVWREPVPLRDVVRAAIAETEDLDRVSALIDDQPAVSGRAVTDVTHLLAELTENAVRFSPPESLVRIRMRPDRQRPGGQLVIVEDSGVGMNDEDLATANFILTEVPDIDLAVSQRLGFHVVARLGARHGIRVTLSPTPGSGVTAVVALPADLFESSPSHSAASEPPSGSTWYADFPAPGAGQPWQGLTTFENGAMVMTPSDPSLDQRLRFGADDTLPNMWVAPEILAADRVVPQQRSESVDGEDGETGMATLRRRVPQSHLVPELRTASPWSPGPTQLASRHVDETADALSRFYSKPRDTSEQASGPGRPDLAANGAERASGVSAWFNAAATGSNPESDPEAE
jgi:signal transduction histidine kinase